MTLIDLTSHLDDAAVGKLLTCAIGYPTPDKLEAICQRYQLDKGWKLLGYELNGAVVGCIGIEIAAPGHAVIQHISVAPELRRRGIGRAMLEQISSGRSLKCVIAETDSKAVGFYRRCGFEIESLGELYPGINRFRCVLKPGRGG